MTHKERIKADAQRFTKDEGYQRAYIEGATAEHDRAQTAIEILQEACNSHVEEKATLIERYPHLAPGIDNYIKPWVAKAIAFLEQWRGEKEGGDGIH